MDLLKNQRSTDDLKRKTLSQTAYLQVSFAKDTKDNEIQKVNETSWFSNKKKDKKDDKEEWLMRVNPEL